MSDGNPGLLENLNLKFFQDEFDKYKKLEKKKDSDENSDDINYLIK